MTSEGRCRETTRSLGGRLMRCQGAPDHDGQCYYYRRGGQGGAIHRWWGRNPRPVGFLGDLGYGGLQAEVWRLRELCNMNRIDWRPGAIGPQSVRAHEENEEQDHDASH